MGEVRYETDVRLGKMLLSDKTMEAKVRRIVAKVLEAAKQDVRLRVSGSFSRDAHMAIRKSVYKKILGGNINIITPRWSYGRRAPLPPVYHKLEHDVNSKGNHRGGNRMPRSSRTEDQLTYMGSDRGFILRFINSGTPGRTTNGTRRVGNISKRNWFPGISQAAINNAAEMFNSLVDKLIEKEFNNK